MPIQVNMEKISRLKKKLLDTVVMSAVALIPLSPILLVGLLYRSTVLFQEFQLQPMDSLLMPLVTVSLVFVVFCLQFSFVDFIIVKLSHALFTKCSVDKKTVDAIFAFIFSFTSSIKMIAYVFSAFCLGNIGCWVMLGIILKPDVAIPLLSAASALGLHIYKYSKTLNKLYNSMNESITNAIDTVANQLCAKSTKKLSYKIASLVDITFVENRGMVEKLGKMVSILARSLLNAPIIRVFTNLNFKKEEKKEKKVSKVQSLQLLNLHVKYMLGKNYLRKSNEEKLKKLATSYPALYNVSSDVSVLEHYQSDPLAFFAQNISEFAYLYEIVCDANDDIFDLLHNMSMRSESGWEEPYVYLLHLRNRVLMAAGGTNKDTALMELLVNGKIHISTLCQVTGLEYPWAAICAMVANPNDVMPQALQRNIGVTGYVSLGTAHAAYIVYRAALNSIAPHPACKCRLKAKVGPDVRKKDPKTGEYVWYKTDGPKPIKAEKGAAKYYRCPRKDGQSACNFFVYKELWHKSENKLPELLEQYKTGESCTHAAHNVYVFLKKHCPDQDADTLAKAVAMLQSYIKQTLSSITPFSKLNGRSFPGLFSPRKLLSGQQRLAGQCLDELKVIISKEKDRVNCNSSDLHELKLHPSSPKRKSLHPSKKSLLRPAIAVVPADHPNTAQIEITKQNESYASLLVHDMPLSLKSYQNSILFMYMEMPGTITYEHFFHYFNFLTRSNEIMEEELDHDVNVAKTRKDIEKRLDNFISLIEIAKTRLYQDNLVKTVSENTKDKVSGVLEKYGISIRTMIKLLILSVVVIVLLIALILHAQHAFGNPGLASSVLASMLCFGGTFGVNRGLTAQNTSPARIAKITEDSGQELQKLTPDLSADFSRSLKSSIKQAAAEQKKSFLNVQSKLQSIEISIESQKDKMVNKMQTEISKLEGKVGEQIGNVKEYVKGEMQTVKHDITRDVGKIKDDVQLSSAVIEDNFKHLQKGRAIEKQTYQQMQNLETSLSTINQRVMENQRSLMAEVAAGREVEEVLGTSFATNMTKAKIAKKLHRKLDIERLQKAKKKEIEILRLLHKKESVVTLDFVIRSESLQCTSFWAMNMALKKLKAFYLDYPRYKERQMSDYVKDTYKKHDNLKPKVEAIERVVTAGELVHDRETLNIFFNECRSMEKKHLALGKHVKDYINIGMEKIEQYMARRRNEGTILVATYEIRDNMESWEHRYEAPALQNILDLLHCLFLILGYKDVTPLSYKDSHLRLQSYKGQDTFKARIMRLNETTTDGSSSHRRSVNGQLGSKLKSITKLDMREEKDTYIVVFYEDEKYKTCSYTKNSAVYLNDTRWRLLDNSGTVKTDAFHSQEFIILEDAKILPLEVKTRKKPSNAMSVLEIAATKSKRKRGKNSQKSISGTRRKMNDEAKGEEEKDSILQSMLPKITPRVTKELLIQATTNVCWDNGNARHVGHTGYISLPFHNKVTIDNTIKTKAINLLTSSSSIMKEKNVHESIEDTFLWTKQTLDNIAPPFEYRY